MRSSYARFVTNRADAYFEYQIAKKILIWKIKARHVNAGFHLAFKRHISFATDLAANSVCNQFRIVPDIVSKLLLTARPSGLVVLLDWKLSRRPFLGQVVD